MNKKKYNFLIPFNLPWDWSADYQRQTCLELSKKYKVIAYIQNDRKFLLKKLFFIKDAKYPILKNIKFYAPIDLIPFKRFKVTQKLNDLINFKVLEMCYLDKNKKIFWIFDPVFYPVLKYFKGKNLYDCVDVIANKDPKTYELIKEYEKKLIKETDYFFVNSETLREKHKKIKKPVKVIPQGFCIDIYKKPLDVGKSLGNKKPIIGFIGAINQRIDFDLVFNLIKRNQKWNFVFWGNIQDSDIRDFQKTSSLINKLQKFDNFIFGKSKDRAEVPNIVKQFDIGIIPYDVSQEASYYCYPMKLFEYFYENKPVVSSGVKEVKKFPGLVKVANNVEEWEKWIKYWLDNPLNDDSKRYQIELAKKNSWEKKISQILKLIGY